MHASSSRLVSGLLAVLIGLAVALGALACDSDDTSETATATESAVATAEPTSEATVAPTSPPAAADHDDGDAALDAAAQVALAMAAADAADTAGFHGMAEDIEASGEVSSRQIRTVGNVLVAVSAPQWDASLEHGAGEMIEALQKLQAALEDGDVEGAVLATGLVHEAQHHFTPEVYNWLGEQQLDTHDDGAILVTGLAAVDIVDATGFHGMAEDLAEATEVNTRFAGQVEKALVAVNAAVWPEDLQGDVDAMAQALTSFHEALAAEDLDAARIGADAVHEAQHGFSGGWYDWLGANHANIDHSHALIAQAAGIKVIDVVDSFGLHGIAEELETATEVNTRLVRNVDNLIAVMNGDHFGPAADIGDELRHHLEELEAALTDGDIASAHEEAVAAHELQHDLSHDMYAWVADSMGDAMVSADGHAHDEEDAHGAQEITAFLEEAPKDQVISLSMDNFSFEPETVEVNAGDVIEIAVENAVDTPHDFTIDQIDADVHVSRLAGTGEHVHIEGMEEADLHFAMTEAGEGLVHIQVHEPGTYEFYCTVPGHRELGMVGTLIVN